MFTLTHFCCHADEDAITTSKPAAEVDAAAEEAPPQRIAMRRRQTRIDEVMPQQRAGNAARGAKSAAAVRAKATAKSAMAGAGKRVSAGAPPLQTPSTERCRSCRNGS